MHLAVMASICGLKNNQQGEIIRAVLLDLLDIENSHIYQDFEKYGASNPFWVMFSNLGLNTVPVEDEYPEKYDEEWKEGIYER